ncbi:MAG: endonuclease/exonuclease/phosphatase family protein [Algisphaera sp.]
MLFIPFRNLRFRAITPLFLFLSLSLALPGIAQSPQQISIGSYNLENFFDIWDNPYTEDEGTKVKSRAQVRDLARAIKALDADVLVVQEFEHEELLEALVKEFLPNAGYQYIAASPSNDGRGILLGILSRYPVTQITSHRLQTFTHPDAPNKPYRFSRDLLRFTVDVGLDRPLQVYNVHLKSNGDSSGDKHSARKRTAEAMCIKQILRDALAHDPDLLAVVAGDFNSLYETRPDEQDRPWPAMAHLLEAEPNGTHVFTDVHAHLTDTQRVTIPSKGRYPDATFDYLLTTPALAQRYIKDSATVIQKDTLTHGSDHRPIKATFRVGDAADD